MPPDNQIFPPKTTENPTIQTDPNTSQGVGRRSMSFIYVAGMRLFVRVFTLPIYALLFVPWLIILIESNNSVLEQKIFNITAFLAGQSTGTSLDAGDIARAVLILFVVIDVFLEIINLLQRKNINKDLYNKKLYRGLIIRCILAVLGWGTLIAVKWSEYNMDVLLIFAIMPLFMCGMFIIEYFIKRVFLGSEVMKIMHERMNTGKLT